jgi:hypothetical protein
MQGLHAQAKPPAFVVAEINVTNEEGFLKEFAPAATKVLAEWAAPSSEDTKLGVLMGPEVDHGEAEVHSRVQA